MVRGVLFWHLLDVGMSLCKVERKGQLDYMVKDMLILHFYTQRTGSLLHQRLVMVRYSFL